MPPRACEIKGEGDQPVSNFGTYAESQAARAQSCDAFSGLSLIHLRKNVEAALKEFGKFAMFEEYTKHDIGHIDRMLALYDWLVPEATKSIMTPADWLLTTVSTYLHDFGLLVTRDEYDARESTAFRHYRERVMESAGREYQDYRAQLSAMGPEASEKFMYQEFVRENHASRIRNWLAPEPEPNLGFDPGLASRLRSLLHDVEPVFVQDLGIVAESHHLDDLGNTEKYPLDRPYGSTPQEQANVQYAAILLRTADLLHITRDRVPAVSALIVNPRNPKSQVEWAKQEAVRVVRPKAPVQGELGETATAEAVEAHAVFQNPEGYFGLTSYLHYASAQLAQSRRWVKESAAKGAAGYEFPWRRVDTDKITAKGFIAEQFQFSIDQAKILDLLTGHTLYNDTNVVVRELLQNALDATRLFRHMDLEPDYVPEIRVEWDPNGRVLTVLDNGTGMSQQVIEENFLRVGSSRYQDEKFLNSFPEYQPISRFGIGVLSAFMVAESVSVVTVSRDEEMARRLDLRDVHGMYLVRLLSKADDDVPSPIRDHGTEVRLHFRPSAEMDDVRRVLEHWIVLPGCRVVLKVDGEDEVEIGASSLSKALERSILEAGLARISEDGKIVSTFGASPIEIRNREVGGAEIAYAVQWSKYLREWTFVPSVGRSAFSPDDAGVYGTCICGVRVTTSSPGFESGGVAAIANAFGKGAPRTNVARSAIERTAEYESLLASVYKTLLDHVRDEMDEFEQNREASPALAAREANYIVQSALPDETRIVSGELLSAAIHASPALVVERGGVRSRVSVEDLGEFPKVVTIQGTTLSRLEQVLNSIRGGTGASLTSLLRALGADSRILGVDLPVLCSRDGLFMRHFFELWEIAAIEHNPATRELLLTWAPIDGGPSRWFPTVTHGIDQALQSLLDAAGREEGWRSAVRFARPHSVVISGFSEPLVYAHGRRLVLPSHAVNALRPAPGVQEDSPERLWIMTALLQMVNRRAAQFGGSADGVGDGGWIRYRLETSGAFRFVTEDSVTDVLREWRVESLDVERWDRKLENM